MPISTRCARGFWPGSSAIRAGLALRRRCARGAGLAAIVLGAGLAACTAHRPASPPPRRVSPVAVKARLVLQPLDLSPDGEARLLVKLRYTDAAGRRAHIPPGGHVDVSSSRGEVQWQPRARYGDPAAIVRLTEPGPLDLDVASDIPRVPRSLRARTDTRGWRLPAVTARALGPHVVQIGWFPRVHDGTVEIERGGADRTRLAFSVDAPASSFRDTTVVPGGQYTYAVRRPGAGPVVAGVGVPQDLPASSMELIRGKAMWLAFDDVGGWNVDAMLDRARDAGIRAIEMRLCYGEYAEVTPARRAAVDRFMDGAAQRGIGIVAWTIPRTVSYEDLAAAVAAAGYRTAAGNGPRGLAVDLERGDDFLGTGETGRAALAIYLSRLRDAVGPRVLLVATVEDPHIEHLNGVDFPYAAIANDADVLQPMVYWRARSVGASVAGMRAELQASFSRLRELAGGDIPIDIGGQTADLGNGAGAPPPDEVAASLVVAQQLGAIGEAFFDWDGTTVAQWNAIAATPWGALAP